MAVPTKSPLRWGHKIARRAIDFIPCAVMGLAFFAIGNTTFNSYLHIRKAEIYAALDKPLRNFRDAQNSKFVNGFMKYRE